MIKSTFDDVFNAKKVFVTGNTGFIGTWLSLWLKSLGANIIGYSLDPPSTPSIFEIIELKKHITNIHGDICDFEKLSKSISKYQPDFVFHLAAQPLVLESYSHPLETFQTNIIGTSNLLESVRNTSSVKVCINFTSDKCYKEPDSGKSFVETDCLGGNDPYSSSKASSEIITSSYQNSFFKNRNPNLSLSTIRAGNVIGGGDWANNRIIPDCIRSLTKKQPIKIRKPKARRPWQHVLESVSGILCLATKMWLKPKEFSGAWNFGPQNSITVQELVEKLINQWGSGSWEIVSSNNSDHEASDLNLDCTKAQKFLGWTPVFKIEEAISQTILWYQNYIEKKNNMFEFSQNQIENYMTKAKSLNFTWINSSNYD